MGEGGEEVGLVLIWFFTLNLSSTLLFESGEAGGKKEVAEAG